MDKVFNIDDINNLTEGDLRDIFDDIEIANQSEIIDNEKKDICPSCNKENQIVEDMAQGFRVCKNCGQVIDNLMDCNPEWRQYEDDKGDSSRCSMPINKLLPQSSLGTTISGGAFKSRLKTLHGWSAMPYKERSLNMVFKEIQSKCQQAGIIKCIEDDAKIMYKSISECKHIKGKNKGKYIIIRGANRRSLIAACVFFACKKKNMTRSPKEISDLFDLKYTEMTRGCKNFTKLVKIRKLEINMGMSLPEHFVIRFCNELKIKKNYTDEVLKIANNINRLNIASDHTPFSIATGSILLMAENNGLSSISKRRIAEKFGVSEVTITKTYKKLWQYRHIILSNDITEKVLKENLVESTQHVIPNEIQDRMKKFGINNDSQNDNKQSIMNIMPINDNDIDLNLDVTEEFKNDYPDDCSPIDIENLDKSLEINLADIFSKLDIVRLNYKNMCRDFYEDINSS